MTSVSYSFHLQGIGYCVARRYKRRTDANCRIILYVGLTAYTKLGED